MTRAPVGTPLRRIAVTVALAAVLVAVMITGLVTVVRSHSDPDETPLPVVGGEVASMPVGRAPEAIAVSADGAVGYVAVSGDGTVSILDLRAGRVTGTVAVGRRPADLALTPDGRALYVVDGSTDDVHVVDVASRRVTATIPVGNMPRAIAIAPDGAAYVTAGDHDGTITEIDTADGTVTAVFDAGDRPVDIAVGAGRLVVANSGGRTIAVIDRSRAHRVTRIDVGARPVHVALGPEGRTAYVATSHLKVATVDLDTGRVVRTSPGDIGPGPLTVLPGGRTLVLTVFGRLLLIDTATGRTTGQVPTGRYHTAIGVSPTGDVLYPVSFEPAAVAVVRLHPDR